MIYTVYHHTAYNYSKFTARRKELYTSGNFLSPCNNLTPYKLQLHKALKVSTLVCDFSQTFHLTCTNSKTKNKSASGAKTNHLSVFNQKRAVNPEVKKSFFKTIPLLCWRSDLAYFNLRWYFLNTFKALHLCWNAVKNNKRIAFIGVDSDCLALASSRACRRLGQTTSLYRDTVPRLRQRAKSHKKQLYDKYALKAPKFKDISAYYVRRLENTAKNHRQGYSKHLNTLSRRGDPSGRSPGTRLNGLMRLINSHYGLKSHDAEPKQPKFDPLLKKQHRLQSLCAQTFIKLPAVAYPTVGTGFFSNPAHALKTVFNHFAKTCIHQAIKTNGLKEHLKYISSLRPATAVKYCSLQINHIGLTPNASFKYYDNETRQLKPIKRRLNEALVHEVCQTSSRASGAFIRQGLKQASTLYLRHASGTYGTNDKEAFAATNLRKYILKSRLCQSHMKALIMPSCSRKGRRRGQKAISYVKPRHTSTSTRSPVFKSYGQRSAGWRTIWHKNNNYAKYMMSTELKDYQKFATNAHLKQADVIFFANPDKYNALAAQAKRLRIPTIGLISGLQPKNQHGSEKDLKQNDSVDYPILGNPENSFFVLMVVRMFMSLIRKAAAANIQK